MSSTARAEDRQDADYYRTPDWAIQDFLTALTDDAPALLGDDLTSRRLVILDPCAGGDASNEPAYPYGLEMFGRWNYKLYTVDIRPDSQALIKDDYLTLPHNGCSAEAPDIIMTNPPFNLALEIIQRALRDVMDGGLVIMLQRLNFFGSGKRKEFWQSHMPLATYVHSDRMRFLEGKNPKTGKAYGGDSIEYAHFVWQSGKHPKFTQLRVI